MKFEQYIPNFFEGFEPEVIDAKDTIDLLANKFFDYHRNYPGFYRFSRSKNSETLIWELKDGKEYWVLGYTDEPLDLPTWSKHDK